MKINAGFVTEQAHYDILQTKFEYVTPPKNSGGGSDFLVVHKGLRATFESKTSNTDIFDAGVLNTFSNGHIFGASSFLVNTHIQQLQGLVDANLSTVQDYLKIVGAHSFPHTINVAEYDKAKKERKLVHLMTEDPLKNIIEHSFRKTSNMFVKANYIVIDDRVYMVSEDPVMDPLALRKQGAAILDDSCIDKVSVRTARSGTRNDRTTVTLRAQFRLNKQLPETKVTLKDLTPPQ